MRENRKGHQLLNSFASHGRAPVIVFFGVLCVIICYSIPDYPHHLVTVPVQGRTTGGSSGTATSRTVFDSCQSARSCSPNPSPFSAGTTTHAPSPRRVSYTHGAVAIAGSLAQGHITTAPFCARSLFAVILEHGYTQSTAQLAVAFISKNHSPSFGKSREQ